MVEVDESAQSFGLPRCLRVPIAARSVAALERFVGATELLARGRRRAINAVLVTPWEHPVVRTDAPLWKSSLASEYESKLHPPKQVWVHVDYTRYRAAYLKAGLTIPEGQFLDHVQNREAVRLRNYSHPFIRLCPVSRSTNTSGGAVRGGEGLEKTFWRSLASHPRDIQERAHRASSSQIVYADPMDLTKMLDMNPGLSELPGVGEALKLFYP